MDSKLISFINTLYIYFLVSMYFWVYLIRGFLIYGILPAFSALVLTIDDISKGEDDDVGNLFKKHNKEFSVYKFQSFIIAMYFIFLYSLLFLMNNYDNSIAAVTIVSLICLLILGAVFFTYYIQVLSFKNIRSKRALMTSYILAIRYFVNSFLIVSVIYLLSVLAKTNLFIFLLLAPFIFGKSTRLITKRCLEQIV